MQAGRTYFEATGTRRKQHRQPRVLRHQAADNAQRAIHQRHHRFYEHSAQAASGAKAG